MYFSIMSFSVAEWLGLLGFCLSVYNCTQQRAAAKRQQKLSLYVQRNDIYKEFLALLEKFTKSDISYPKDADALNKYCDRIKAAVNEFEKKTVNRKFLFDNEVLNFINQTLDELSPVSCPEYPDYSKELHHKRWTALMGKIERTHLLFDKYLNFGEL